jgi:hypothetical protein
MKLLTHYILLAACLLAIPGVAVASGGEAEAGVSAASRVIASSGLAGDQGCLHFVDRNAVIYRKQKWADTVQAIAAEDPDYLIDWIIGATPPPPEVVSEAERQKDCLIERIVAEATAPDVELIIDYEDRWSKKSEMAQVFERYQRGGRFHNYFTRRLTRSFVRDAETQSWIWKRKFDFRNRSFNRISERAAELCNLPVGHSWKPDSTRHSKCWKRTLSPTDRELEILVASSAPGISRHHWGTEFDLFSLNPRNFAEEARMVDEWRWMTAHAYEFGYFQPYTQGEHGAGYMEERWHWSYYPIGQALLEWAHANQAKVEVALNQQWDAFEKRWSSRGTRYFDFVRANWRSYVFTVDTSSIEKAPATRAAAGPSEGGGKVTAAP